MLREAGIERASAFAAVSSGDNSNIISARVARETFGIERVVARIYDAKRAAVYERLGIPTVATVPWTTDRLLRMLLPEGVATAWRDPSGAMAVLLLPLHEEWAGHSVAELEQTTGSRVAFIVRFGGGVLPTPDTIVQADDDDLRGGDVRHGQRRDRRRERRSGEGLSRRCGSRSPARARWAARSPPS